MYSTRCGLSDVPVFYEEIPISAFLSGIHGDSVAFGEVWLRFPSIVAEQ
jgi:hypothetical protein